MHHNSSIGGTNQRMSGGNTEMPMFEIVDIEKIQEIKDEIDNNPKKRKYSD